MVDKDFRPQRLDPDDWQAGFTHGTGGMFCNRCRCLVRQSPGDARAHLDWHELVEGDRPTQPGSLGGDNGGG